MQVQKIKAGLITLVLISITLLSGCSFAPTQQYQYSDEVGYLYPKGVGQVPQQHNGVSVAALPLRMGIAFVPDRNPGGPDSALLEQQKMQLMQEIKQQLLVDAVIEKVELIPSSYLTSSGSFSDLDRVSRVFGVDTIFLFSFEQAQYTDRGLLSLGYWTIIGAYFIPGEKNDTNSMISGVAYDIRQRQMLFRADGVSQSKELSTPVNYSQEIREERILGFKKAAEDLVSNLDIALEDFKMDLRQTTPALDTIKPIVGTDDGFWSAR